MPSTEQAPLIGLFSWGLLVSCHLGMLASALISWSLSNQNNLELAGRHHRWQWKRRLWSCGRSAGQVTEV